MIGIDEPLYPINLRLSGESVLVVGGGAVALTKVRELLVCGASVTIVAPAIRHDLATLENVTCVRRAYRSEDSDGHRLVITATDDPLVNRQVADDAKGRGLWVNSADDPANCTFTLPSRIRQGPLLVTFATGGQSPALATWLRRRYTDEFGPEYLALIDLFFAERQRIRDEGRSTEGLDWQPALDSGMLELIREGRLAEAKERLQACLS